MASIAEQLAALLGIPQPAPLPEMPSADAATHRVLQALARSDQPQAARNLAALLSSAVQYIERRVGRIPMLRQVTSASFSEEVPTVGVNLALGGLLFNPMFFQTWVRAQEDIVFLLLHERGHLVLNYVASTAGVTNFEEDVVINITAIPLSGSKMPERLYRWRADSGEPLLMLMQPDEDLATQYLWSQPWAQVEDWEYIRDTLFHAYGYGYIYTNVSRLMQQVRRWREAVSSKREQCSPPPKTAESGADSPLIPPPGLGNAPRGLGHEEGNQFQQKAREQAQEQADRHKRQRPGAYGKGGSPVGESHEVSFAALHAPDQLGILSMEQNLYRIPVILRTPSATTGTVLTTALSTSVGAALCDTVLDSRAPLSRISQRDTAALASGYIPSAWEHASAPDFARVSAYLDFSGSMTPYWGVLLSVAKALRFKIHTLYGFASTLSQIDFTSGGLSVGGGTRLTPVLEQMKSDTNQVVVWATDLEFYPTLHAASDTVEAALRRIRKLIVLCPIRVLPDTLSARRQTRCQIANHFFSGLSPVGRSRITIILVDMEGNSG